jgi:hypothetical protein
MNRQAKIGALLLLILVPVIGLVAIYSYYSPIGNGSGSLGVYGTLGPCFNVTVKIEYGEDYGHGVNQTFAGLSFPSGATVFEALANVTLVEYQYSGQLVLVTSINGVHNNAVRNLFWQYYVDGVFGPVASNIYHLGNNSLVEWRYQSSQF